MPKILASTELRNSYNDVSTWCHHTGEPAFVTKNGAGDLAVMSVQAYDELMVRLDMYEFIEKGRKDVAAGSVAPAQSHIEELRERYSLR